MKRKNIKELIRHNGTVCGICFDENDKIVLINSKRFGQDEYWEIPGGIVEENENPVNTIKREIREEIGCNVIELRELIRFNTSVGLTDEVVSLYKCRIDNHNVKSEYKLLRISIKELIRMVDNGEIMDVKTIQAANELRNKYLKNFEKEYSEIISIWDIQDSLLQAYRTIFITSQSVLFSISVFISTSIKPYYIFFVFPMGLYLLWLMYKLTRKRGFGVWFCQLQILKIEKNSFYFTGKFLTEFKKFMQLSNKKKAIILKNDKIGKGLISDRTRKSMDFEISGIFLALWIALVVVTLLI